MILIGAFTLLKWKLKCLKIDNYWCGITNIKGICKVLMSKRLKKIVQKQCSHTSFKKINIIIAYWFSAELQCKNENAK